MSTHSEWSPSRLSRIVLCPGSVAQARSVPVEPQNPAAALGSLKHAHVERILGQPPETWDELTGKIDAELRSDVGTCIDFMRGLLEPDGMFFTELRVSLGMFGVPEVEGTLDLLIINPTNYHIIDWKFGTQVIVHAHDNAQLRSYALGAYAMFHKLYSIDPDKPCTLHIVQPPVSHFSEEETTFTELVNWCDSVVYPAVQSSQADEPPLCPGPKQCQWCPARAVCQARMTYAHTAAAEVFKDFIEFREGRLVNKERLVEMLAICDDITKLGKDIRAFAVREITRGSDFPGFKLVHKQARRKWIDESAVLEFLDSRYNLSMEDVFSEPKLVSPSQVEQMHRKLKKDPEFKALYSSEPSSIVLTTEDDARPAITSFKSVADIFADFIEEE